MQFSMVPGSLGTIFGSYLRSFIQRDRMCRASERESQVSRRSDTPQTERTGIRDDIIDGRRRGLGGCWLVERVRGIGGASSSIGGSLWCGSCGGRRKMVWSWQQRVKTVHHFSNWTSRLPKVSWAGQGRGRGRSDRWSVSGATTTSAVHRTNDDATVIQRW